MSGLLGLTQTVHVLPIALVFVGATVCFAGWVAMMIRSQQRERWARRPVSLKEPRVVAARQAARAAARAWMRASRVPFVSDDRQASAPYPLPMAYAVVKQGPATTVNVSAVRVEYRGSSLHSTLDRSPSRCCVPARATPCPLLQRRPSERLVVGNRVLGHRLRTAPRPAEARRSVSG